MFTGIIRARGSIQHSAPRGDGRVIEVAGLPSAWQSGVGDSIAVQGICLTIEAVDGNVARFYASAETLDRTTLAEWPVGRAVHIEAALRAGDRLDGHMVQGHVDGVGRILGREVVGEDLQIRFGYPALIAEAVFPKGSIAVDGVSLTINACDEAAFVVNLIPHTRRETLFDGLPDGAAINLEADPIAKQVAWVLRARAMYPEVPR